jgi:alpha-galactosidase
MRSFLTTLSLLLAVLLVPVVSILGAPPAHALDNGLAKTPPMGFNDWNAFGCDVSEALLEQTADVMVSSGMRDAGYQNVNADDCWLTHSRDAGGNLVADPVKFPHGIKAVADYVHARGLKFGIYEDAGTATCAGYPGSLGHERQDAALFASWDVDYLKYDWCNIPFDQFPGQSHQQVAQRLYTTMRDALATTGRPIVFSMCNGWDPAVQPWSWAQDVSNLWRTTHDISDNYGSMLDIFHQNVALAADARPGAWNDPDMLEVGNGGMTDTEYRSHFSLWAEMAAPLIAGTDLRKANQSTLDIYRNTEVIAVDQDALGVQGRQVSTDGTRHVLAKPLSNGDVAVTLFNEGDTATTVTTTAQAVGLPKAPAYTLHDLWSHTTTETAGTIRAYVPAHGTAMYRVARAKDPGSVPPSTMLSLDGANAWLAPGQAFTVTGTFANDGRIAVSEVRLTAPAPSGWTVTPTTPTTFGAVAPGRSVQATWRVTPGSPTAPITTAMLTGRADYVWGDRGTAAGEQAQQAVHVASPVQSPYRTYASTEAHPGQLGDRFAIAGDGTDVWTGNDEYGAIYLPGAERSASTATIRVDGQQVTSDWAKSGLMVRDDISKSGSSPGYLILALTPQHGVALQWDNDGNGYLDSSTTAGDSTLPHPTWLRLVRAGTTYTAYYSTDGTTWQLVGSATLPTAAPTQDVGAFTTSHSAGTIGESDLSAFTVS